MPVDAAKIAQLEKELEEARRQLLMENGKRYDIIRREISEDEFWASQAAASCHCSHPPQSG